MSGQPELPGLRPHIPVSMQERTVLSHQQKALETPSSMGCVLTTDTVMKNLPLSIADCMNPVQSVAANDPADMQAGFMVMTSAGSSAPRMSAAPQAQSTVVYSLSEAVMKERESLFKPDKNDTVSLEPPRAGNQTVRMRSKNFFTVLEVDDESDEKQTSTESTTEESTVRANVPLYTPIFNFGQSLHTIFNNQNKRKHRQNKGLVLLDETTDKPAQSDTSSTSSSSSFSSGYESDPEHFVHLYEKITINQKGLRRNSSQPNLTDSSVEEFSRTEEERVISSHSQSMPTTPQRSPRLTRRRNSATSTDMMKPESLKPEATGPGLSFLASVAGELRAHKKRHTDNISALPAQKKHIPDAQVAKVNPDTKVVKVSEKPVKLDQPNTTMAECDLQTNVEKARQLRGYIFKTSKESDSSTSPKINRAHADMKAGTVSSESSGGKKSIIKTLVDWSTKPQANVSNKESNMYSPSSY